LCYVIGERVQQTRPSRALHFHGFCSVLFVTHQRAGHAFAGDSGFVKDFV